MYARLCYAASGPCRLPAPLSWRMLVPDEPTRVQRAILREYLAMGNTLARLFDLATVLMFWPWRSMLAAWRLTQSAGRQVADSRSLPNQFIQQVGLAWFHGISPPMYYQLGIAVCPSGHRPTRWLQDGHAGLLSRVFRADKRLIEINDKALFARMLSAADVPHPQTVAVTPFDDPAGAALFEMLENHRELFLKRGIGHGGKGSRILIKEDSHRWSIHDRIPSPSCAAPVVAETELIEQLRKSGEGECWLMQPRLGNHPLLARLFGPGLISVRVVSARSERHFAFLGSLVSFAAPEQLVSQRGLKVGVEVESGRMSKVFHYSADQREYRCNPHTGERVEGVQLPFWEEVLEIVGRAHAVMPDFPFLGWDVAICPTGPVMLEANGNFGVAGLQRPGRKPLIDEQFLRVFGDWDARHRGTRR